jgi:SnoaL-like domain
MNRISRCALQLAGSLLLLTAAADGARADPPASAAAPAAGSAPGEVSEVKGGFLSTFTQAFKEDFDREAVRGHFDTGSAPDTHRYYCLVNPKTGRNEPNAVSGQTVSRRDGTTGVSGVAVSPLSCADAEQKGLLITSGYVLLRGAPSAKAGVSGNAVPPPAQPAAAAAPVAAPPSAVAAAAVAAPAVATAPAAVAVPTAPAAAADNGAQWEIMAVYSRFIAGQNAHDRAAVAAVLLDSQDFVWTPYGGEAVWGYREALEAFERQWQGTCKLEPQLKELHIASVAADTAVLVTPLLLTLGKPGAAAATVAVSWGGVFVRTRSGWRLASIFITPLPDRHAAGGG